ncbi:MAG TPA: hypothetical protein VMV28_03805 [Thermoplasmata archaeon]|nr:hypothetical protein [Thermoplasmata archaeon]
MADPAPSPRIDPSIALGVTDEWKEARLVVDNADTQLAGLRQYGMTFVAGLLAAQGLIEFPLNSSSQAVPNTVKLAIILASYALILGIFDLDLRTRMIQRGAAQRAVELEGTSPIASDGMRLTETIGESYAPWKSIASIDVLYIVFLSATTILGFGVLGASLLVFSYNALVLGLVFLGCAILIVVAGGDLKGKRSRGSRFWLKRV